LELHSRGLEKTIVDSRKTEVAFMQAGLSRTRKIHSRGQSVGFFTPTLNIEFESGASATHPMIDR
jgi:hypothetical protein